MTDDLSTLRRKADLWDALKALESLDPELSHDPNTGWTFDLLDDTTYAPIRGEFEQVAAAVVEVMQKTLNGQ